MLRAVLEHPKSCCIVVGRGEEQGWRGKERTEEVRERVRLDMLVG